MDSIRLAALSDKSRPQRDLARHTPLLNLPPVNTLTTRVRLCFWPDVMWRLPSECIKAKVCLTHYGDAERFYAVI